MPSHRIPTAFLLPVLLAGGACAGIASAQATSQFTNSGQALGDSLSFSVALGDLDGDGDLDAMVANFEGFPNTVWTNDGNGTFTNSGQALGNSNSTSVALGELDGDGDLDAMVANDNQPNTVWNNSVTCFGSVIGDVNCDGVYDETDVRLGMVEYGIVEADACPADLNGDGVVDGFDLTVVLGAWGLPCDG